jgi:hypothetical protein
MLGDVIGKVSDEDIGVGRVLGRRGKASSVGVVAVRSEEGDRGSGGRKGGGASDSKGGEGGGDEGSAADGGNGPEDRSSESGSHGGKM